MGSACPEMLRKSNTGKPAMNSASSGETPKTDTDLNNMIRTPTNYNKNQRNTAGQEEDGSDCDLGPKGREDSELPKVMKVSNSLKDLADAGKDERDAAGYGLRVMATEADLGSHTNPDATATTWQEHVDDCVGGGDKDGVMDQRKLSRRKSVDPIRPPCSDHYQVQGSSPEVGQGWSGAWRASPGGAGQGGRSRPAGDKADDRSLAVSQDR